MELNERIKQARKIRGLTLKEVADFVGVNPTSVYRWESNNTTANSISIENMIKLADILGLSLDELTGRKAAPKSKPLDKSAGEFRHMLQIAIFESYQTKTAKAFARLLVRLADDLDEFIDDIKANAKSAASSKESGN